MADKQYTIIHEIGDYYRGNDLNDKDNKAYNEQMNRQKKDKDNKEKE